jgi:hypothetical protein
MWKRCIEIEGLEQSVLNWPRDSTRWIGMDRTVKEAEDILSLDLRPLRAPFYRRKQSHHSSMPYRFPRGVVAKSQNNLGSEGGQAAGLRDGSCGLVEESVDDFHRARRALSRVFIYFSGRSGDVQGQLEASRWAAQLDRLAPSVESNGLTSRGSGSANGAGCWHGTGAEVDGGDRGRWRHRTQ